jgi:amino acid transporter
MAATPVNFLPTLVKRPTFVYYRCGRCHTTRTTATHGTAPLATEAGGTPDKLGAPMDDVSSFRLPPITSPPGAPEQHDPPRRLRGQLGVIGLVFAVLAFNAPLAVMAGFVPFVISTGNQLGAPVTFVVIGILLVLFSVGFTAMSRFMKSPGAFYCYIAAGIGKAPGLGAAFLAFTAYFAIGAGSYCYTGIVARALVHDVLGGPDLSWWVYAAVLWVIASVMTLFNIELSAKVLGVTMCCEIVMMLIWNAAVLINGGPQGRTTEPFTFHAFTSGSLSFALLFGVLCVTGFEAVAVFREEAREPEKTVPRATYAAVAFLAVLYGVGSWVYIVAFGPSAAVAAAADPSGSFTASIHQYVGNVAVDIVSVLLVTSGFAAILADQSIAARYLYALGSDRVLSKALGAVHHKHGSPYIAAIVVSALSLIAISIPAAIQVNPVTLYGSFTGFGGLCLLILMTSTSIAIIAFFRRDRTHQANRWQSQIAPVIAFAGLATILVLATTHMDLVMGGSKLIGDLAVGLAVVLAASGIIVGLRYRRRQPEIYNLIGQRNV